MKKRIRTGITSITGGFGLYERCNKHGKVWAEGTQDESKCCMECINKARPTKYKRK